MDGNREEATRLKILAQNNMDRKDFVSALGLAVKAQQLCPDLENISMIITVCDVICSSNKKVNGNENDWYGILRVETTADDTTIKKQYRKFALHLHPDKNKFTGASDAFNLISQAQNVLLDRNMRIQYDLKLQAAKSNGRRVNYQAYTKPYVKRQAPHLNSFNDKSASKYNNLQQQQQQNNQSANDRSTFWTTCPHCKNLFMYYMKILGKLVVCRNCNVSFTTLENKSFSPSPASLTKPSSMQKEEAGINLCKKASDSGPKSLYTKIELKKDVSDKQSLESQNGIASVATETSKPKRKSLNVESMSKDQLDTGKSGSRMLKKRKLMVPDNSHSKMESQKESDEKHSTKRKFMVPDNSHSKMESQKESDEKHSRVEHGGNPTSGFVIKTKDGNSNVESIIKESNEFSELNNIIFKKRKVEKHDSNDEEKQIYFNGDHVIQKNDSSDVESVKDNKAGLCMNTEENHITIKGIEMSLTKEIPQHGKKDDEIEFHTYLDSEFSNFDNLRAECIFKKGQIWAAYDSLDAMPRFYAIITEVFSPDFKVELTWLEPDPDDEEEIKWIEKGLPVSCGKFVCGRSDVINDIRMFSHPVYWEKRSGECTYEVHPRRGETWALFKGWDINWHACSETKKKYSYEYVEVLSEYSRAEGVYVAFLTKLEGFSCTFSREKKGACSVLIPTNEKFRFSHKVPSFKMTGKDSNTLVTGSFELDPASLLSHEDGKLFSEVSNLVDREMHPPSLYHKPTADQAVNGKAESQGFACQQNMESVKKVDVPVGGFDKVELKQRFGSSLQDLVENNVEPIKNQNNLSQLQSGMENNEVLLESKSASNTPSTKDDTQTSSKFYNFAKDKSPYKFQTGQIWAIYSKEAAAPKCYGMIKKIDPFPAFKLHVTGLDHEFSTAEGNICSASKGINISCGNFKLKRGRPARYTDTDLFSHQVKAEVSGSSDRNAVYAIFPKKGEVWAMYKDCKLNDYTCEIVEVKEETDISLTVSVLEPFQHFKCLFRPRVIKNPNDVVQVYKTDLFRFSHQIPAYRQTDEEGGFWDLDTKALQNYLLHP